MWTPKARSHFTGIAYLTVYILAATSVLGCENRKSFYDNNRNDINLVPIQMENPEEPILDEAIDPVYNNTIDLDKPKTPRTREGKVAPAPKTTTPDKAGPKSPLAAGVNEASLFIKSAFWVVQNEARKIGTPCNFYVSRVLVLTGYSKDGFLANDFDLYARKNFSSYKSEIFNTSNIESERQRLRHYIWSYPTRTPFIFQWERSAPQPGHIAIVERIGDQLVVYQASLNLFIARREQTTVDRLLSQARSARMTVYSEFVAK